MLHGDADTTVRYEGNGLLGLQLGNPSVPERMAAWARHNRCGTEPVERTPRDGVKLTSSAGCTDDVEVELWTLIGQQHVWPSGDPVDGTEVVLDFFDGVSRAGVG